MYCPRIESVDQPTPVDVDDEPHRDAEPSENKEGDGKGDLLLKGFSVSMSMGLSRS